MSAKLRKHKLLVNGKKSEFFMTEIPFLSHIISKDEVGMDLAKLEAIKNWPNTMVSGPLFVDSANKHTLYQ